MKYQIGHFVIVNDSLKSKHLVGKITGLLEGVVCEYYVQTKFGERSYADNKFWLKAGEPQDYLVCSVADISFQTHRQHRDLMREIDCINCILEG